MYLPKYKTNTQIKLLLRRNILLLISYTEYTKHVRLYVPLPKSCLKWSLNISFMTDLALAVSEAISPGMTTSFPCLIYT